MGQSEREDAPRSTCRAIGVRRRRARRDVSTLLSRDIDRVGTPTHLLECQYWPFLDDACVRSVLMVHCSDLGGGGTQRMRWKRSSLIFARSRKPSRTQHDEWMRKFS